MFESAIEALKDAGAKIVEFELLPFFVETQVDGVGAFDLNINYEMPRELARWVLIGVGGCWWVSLHTLG